ncbi:MAG: histidine phosphatase family protein [Pseudomonadota bacterium]
MTPPTMARPGLAALLMLAAGLASPALRAEPPLVVLVRHADRGSEPADDPGLSLAGQSRAKALGQSLAFAQIGAVVTTQFRRTRETGQAVAERLGLGAQQVQVVEARAAEDAAVHIAEVVATVRRQSAPVLVVGHGNTVPAVLAALGGPKLPDLCETSYGLAFVLVPGAKPVTLQMRYGEPDPAPAAGCL